MRDFSVIIFIIISNYGGHYIVRFIWLFCCTTKVGKYFKKHVRVLKKPKAFVYSSRFHYILFSITSQQNRIITSWGFWQEFSECFVSLYSRLYFITRLWSPCAHESKCSLPLLPTFLPPRNSVTVNQAKRFHWNKPPKHTYMERSWIEICS